MAINYTEYRGDDVTFNLNFTDDNDDAIDITNYTVFFTLKNSRVDSDANAVFKQTLTEADHTAPASGETQITLTNSDTDSLLGSYYYDMQYKNNVGTVKTIQSGRLTFKRDVTRRTS